MAKNHTLFVEKLFKGAALRVKKSSFVSCLALLAERCCFKGIILVSPEMRKDMFTYFLLAPFFRNRALKLEIGPL